MRKIEILKNGKVIKTITCTTSQVQKAYNYAVDITGGLWNGVDEFSVRVL